MLASRDERPRQRRFRFGDQSLFVVADETAGDHGSDDRADQRGNSHGSGVMFKGVAEKIAAEAKQARPNDCAKGIEQKEPPPFKPIDPRQESRKSAQHRNEASKKHDLAAVPLKQILPELQPPLVQMDIS